MNIVVWTGFKCENRVQRRQAVVTKDRKYSGVIKDEELRDNLSKCQILKKGSTARNY